MGQRFVRNKNNVSENKEIRRRIREEGKTLTEEFASLKELSGMIESLDDDIVDSIIELESVQLKSEGMDWIFSVVFPFSEPDDFCVFSFQRVVKQFDLYQSVHLQQLVPVRNIEQDAAGSEDAVDFADVSEFPVPDVFVGKKVFFETKPVFSEKRQVFSVLKYSAVGNPFFSLQKKRTKDVFSAAD